MLHEAHMDWGKNKPKQQILEYMLSWYSLTKVGSGMCVFITRRVARSS